MWMGSWRRYAAFIDSSLQLAVQLCRHTAAYIVQHHGKWGYEGGRRLFHSVSAYLGYSDLMYKMCEKLKTDVSLKYLSPGNEVLVDVADDDDVQVSILITSQHSLHG